MSFARPNLNFELTAAGLLALVGLVSLLQDSPKAVLRLDGVCCRLAASTIVRRIKSVPGVTEARYVPGEIRLEMSTSSDLIHDEIWKVAHRAPIEPVSLSVNGRTVLSRSLK